MGSDHVRKGTETEGARQGWMVDSCVRVKQTHSCNASVCPPEGKRTPHIRPRGLAADQNQPHIYSFFPRKNEANVSQLLKPRGTEA